MGEPRHGVDGWSLEEYTWSDGVGHYLYSRTVSGKVQTQPCERPQPTQRHHAGWGR